MPYQMTPYPPYPPMYRPQARPSIPFNGQWNPALSSPAAWPGEDAWNSHLRANHTYQ